MRYGCSTPPSHFVTFSERFQELRSRPLGDKQADPCGKQELAVFLSESDNQQNDTREGCYKLYYAPETHCCFPFRPRGPAVTAGLLGARDDPTILSTVLPRHAALARRSKNGHHLKNTHRVPSPKVKRLAMRSSYG